MPLPRLPLHLASKSGSSHLRCDSWLAASTSLLDANVLRLRGQRRVLLTAASCNSHHCFYYNNNNNTHHANNSNNVNTNAAPHHHHPDIAIPATRPFRSPRSPHQWSHIVHHIHRPPTMTAASASMASQLNAGITQVRTHMGHSHGHGHHHHHHDTTYLTSADKNDPGVRITRTGLYVNLGMAVVKGAGGYIFNSKALIADAVHALTDLVSDVTTLATISYSLRPASSRFPLGYGKFESIGALAVSTILLTGGIAIGIEAVLSLSQQLFPEVGEFLSHNIGLLAHSHSHSHGGGHEHGHGVAEAGPHIHAAWLAAGSIGIKEWLYRATMKVAKEKRSSILASNAYHHRVDSLTAFVALFTILASHVMEGARWLDPVGGLIISGMVVQAGWTNTKLAFQELADAGVDEEVRDSVHAAAMAVVNGLAAEIRGVQGIKSGQNLMFEVEVGLPEDWTIAQANKLETELREKIAASVRGTKRVIVRFTTAANSETPFLDQFVTTSGRKVGIEDGHHHHHEHGHEHDHAHEHENGRANGHAVSSADPSDTTHKRR